MISDNTSRAQAVTPSPLLAVWYRLRRYFHTESDPSMHPARHRFWHLVKFRPSHVQVVFQSRSFSVGANQNGCYKQQMRTCLGSRSNWYEQVRWPYWMTLSVLIHGHIYIYMYINTNANPTMSMLGVKVNKLNWNRVQWSKHHILEHLLWQFSQTKLHLSSFSSHGALEGTRTNCPPLVRLLIINSSQVAASRVICSQVVSSCVGFVWMHRARWPNFKFSRVRRLHWPIACRLSWTFLSQFACIEFSQTRWIGGLANSWFSRAFSCQVAPSRTFLSHVASGFKFSRFSKAFSSRTRGGLG